jgi:predicted ribosome quality control (RQC) complex YloA/Tae2 family protein
VGRHFRLDEQTKIIVGKDESDNRKIESYRQPEFVCLEAADVGSPITLLIGEVSDDAIEKAAMVTARYCAARKESQVEVLVSQGDAERKIVVNPATIEEAGGERIE